jgi:hypothetical protein
MRAATLIYPGDPSGGSGFAVPHDILSAVHDATTAAPTQGALIVANATPEWDRLAHPGVAYQHLESDTSTLSWVTNLTMTSNAWIGRGSTAARIVFEDVGNELGLHRGLVMTLYSDAGTSTTGEWDASSGDLTLYSDLIFSNSADGIVHPEGHIHWILVHDGSRFIPQAMATSSLAQHDILSTWHSDVITDHSVTAGDIIYGGTAPEWLALSIGSAYDVLRVNSAAEAPEWVSIFDGTDPASIEPDDAAGTGTAITAARRDHQHAIVCEAPDADSVNVAASAEGGNTTFARSNHTHNLDESIAPTWTGQHYFSNTLNALTDLSDPSNYHIVVRNPADDTGEMIALGFYISVEDNDVGGAIGFYRTGAETQGEMRFYVKTSTAEATDPVLALTLEETGDGTFQYGLVANEGGGDNDSRIEGNTDVDLFYVNAGTDRVGISTNSPDATLDVAGDLYITNGATQVIRMYNNEDFSTAPDIRFSAGGAIAADDSLYLLFDADNGSTTAATVFGINSATNTFTEICRITEGGDIGLGTTTPGINLAGAVADLTGYVLEIQNTTAARLALDSNYPAIHWGDRAGALNTKIFNAAFDGGLLNFFSSNDGGTVRNNHILVLTHATGRVGVGDSAPGSLMEWNFATEDLEFVNAGSAGATEQDWIEVQVGGVTGYIRVYASV